MIDQFGGLRISKFAAERLKVRKARTAEDCCFAVYDRVSHLELVRSLDDRRKLLGPVVSAPGIDSDLSIANMDLAAVTVGFDLVRPVAADRRPLVQGRIAGLDKPGHRRLTCGSQSAQPAS